MKEIHDLREKLFEELKGYGKKELSAGSLDVIDKLSHSIKNLDKIISGEAYSNAYGGNYTRRGMNRGYSYHNEGIISEVRELMEEAPDEKTKQEFRRFIQKLESM